MRILGLGDCCVDYYIHKKMAFPGGNAFNVAVYAAENGAEAGFLGTVGDDVIGEHI
ncbi:MAG: PfkB family carbohydrate kinase [Blautia faecis]